MTGDGAQGLAFARRGLVCGDVFRDLCIQFRDLMLDQRQTCLGPAIDTDERVT